MNTFAYVRVSTAEQHTDRQLIALEPFGIPRANIFVDKQSGKDFDRKHYRRLIKKLQPGDLLYLHSIDRLGRNYDEILKQWRILTKDKQIDIIVLDMPALDTTQYKDLLGTFISNLILNILSYVAQTERERMLVRQREGIAAAKQNGVRFGRKPMELPCDFEEIVRRWRRGELTAKDAAKLCGFSRDTLYEKTKEMREREEEKKAS
ncbi:MAG: recombinase family protein [Clostridiales bacterium]|nr:recombinase family protein [Clostridiales bacterium]